MRRTLIALSLLLACAALAGCGAKGPLVRPAANNASVPATASSTAPTPATPA